MEYQKIINLLGNSPDQPSKFRAKNSIEVNDDSWGTYNTNGQVKFKTLKLNSSLCDYSDGYILVKETMTVVAAGPTKQTRQADTNNKQAILKNCAPFTDFVTEIKKRQIDNVKDLDVVMPMYDLEEYGDNYSGTTGSLWQYCEGEPEDPITDSNSFKFKSRFLTNINEDDILNAEIAVSLK